MRSIRRRTAAGTRHEVVAELCRQARDALSAIGMPATFSLAELHERIEDHRGRTIHLLPQALPERSPCGIWIAAAEADYVFYDRAATPLHRTAIIAHEFGHMVFDDEGAPSDLRDVATLLMPDLDAEWVTRRLARTTYEEYRELRAEIFGSTVVAHAGRWTDTPAPGSIDPTVLERMVATLGAGRRNG